MLSRLGRIDHVRSCREAGEIERATEGAVERRGREKREGEGKRERAREKVIYTVLRGKGEAAPEFGFQQIYHSRVEMHGRSVQLVGSGLNLAPSVTQVRSRSLWFPRVPQSPCSRRRISG